ncbi:MAG TPA: hypothetical protein VGF49_19055 [Candidatus Solibacter sp.]
MQPGLDETWVFALNFAAAHGLAAGRDVVWTTGPLGYLVFPQDLGGNLAKALAFQAAVWALLIAVLTDLFFRSRIPLRNLAAFTIFFAISAPLYWFNYMGIENLLIAATLVLLLLTRIRGGTLRYLTALVLIGVIPLIKLTGGVIAAGALAGFLLDQIIRLRWKALRDVTLGIVVPLLSAAIAFRLTLPSFEAFQQYLAASRDIAGEFSAAMSTWGRPVEFLMGIEILILVGAFLYLQFRDDRKLTRFCVLLLAVPAMISTKHGFVRQDVHLENFICFAALVMALIALQIDWSTNRRVMFGALIGLPFLVLWQDYVIPVNDNRPMLSEITGFRAVRFGAKALVNFGAVRRNLRAAADTEMSKHPEARIEPELRAVIGDSPVASMSLIYSGAFAEGLNLRVYPVVQRYSAYTPYLDGLNAAWIRDRGPRFLLFGGEPIDSRDPWAETPSMWLEVYRWYNTRLLGERNVLLERRAEPRFQRLESIGRTVTSPDAGLKFPASDAPVFWTMNCPLNAKGKVRKLVYRLTEVHALEKTCSGVRAPRRVLPAVLTTPVMGSSLPGSLAEFAAVFAGTPLTCAVESIAFESGLGSYSGRCEIEFFRPVN